MSISRASALHVFALTVHALGTSATFKECRTLSAFEPFSDIDAMVRSCHRMTQHGHRDGATSTFMQWLCRAKCVWQWDAHCPITALWQIPYLTQKLWRHGPATATVAGCQGAASSLGSQLVFWKSFRLAFWRVKERLGWVVLPWRSSGRSLFGRPVW